MKINELEKILNVSRANIRFYEKEGLLTPERNENGYREYDENEISILKKIIIYRKLGISIPNIKDIFAGKLTLSDSMNESINSINSELTELAVSAKLCREIKNQGVDDSTFDEEYYWNEINRIESTGEEFYNFAGLDINNFEKRSGTVKYKVIFGITSAILLLFTFVVGISRYSVALVEYNSNTFNSFSELHHIPVIEALFPVCAVLTAFFALAFIIALKRDVLKGKRFWLFFIIGIVFSGVAMGTTISISYETAIFDECYADIILPEEEAIKVAPEYKRFFPYYDDFYEYVGAEFNYSYSRCEIPQAVYVHIQNFSWYENDALYDVEYFETDDNQLLYQFSFQKGVPVYFENENIVYPEGLTKTIDGIEYLIHQHENYYEIRIINDTTYFSIVLKDFNEMLELDETAFTEMAMKQYEIMQNDAKNSHGESRELSEEF